MACGFESELGNALKAGLVGLGLGGLAWLVLGAFKGKSDTGDDRQRARLEEARERRQQLELEQRREERRADQAQRERARLARESAREKDRQERLQMRDAARAAAQEKK